MKTRHRLKENATVYSEANSASETIAALKAGDIISVDDNVGSKDGHWDAVVLVNGVTGYISGKTKATKLDSLPTAPVPAGIELLFAGVLCAFGFNLIGIVIALFSVVGAVAAFGGSRSAVCPAWMALIYSALILFANIGDIATASGSHFGMRLDGTTAFLFLVLKGGLVSAPLSAFAVYNLRPRKE